MDTFTYHSSCRTREVTIEGLVVRPWALISVSNVYTA